MINIRPALLTDAESLINLFNTLDKETDFMLMEPGERNLTMDQQSEILEKFSNPSTGFYVVAEDDETREIIGFIAGSAGMAKRNRHCISLVIGLLQAYSGQGLGKEMMLRQIKWSKQHQFKRIELTVLSHNERAINLYKSCGFEIEGLKKDALKINHKFFNEFYMAKIH